MSLLSQWTEDKNNINTALDKSELNVSSSDLESKFMNKNQWRCLKYNLSYSSTPSYSTIQNYAASAVHYRNHDTSQNWNWGDSYIGVRECYVYCNKDYTLNTSFFTDDAGRIYLNGSSITTSTSCQTKSVSLPFKKGLNHVEIMFQEGSGGDAAYLNTNLATQSWVDWMYACYKS